MAREERWRRHSVVSKLCGNSFHFAGDPRDWETSICAMEQAQASGSWESVCSFLRVPFGPLLHTLSYINGTELARFETACPPLARTRICESASKAMVMASVRQKGVPLDPKRLQSGNSWKQLTGWIGSPPAWCVLHDLYESTDGANSWEWSEGWARGDIDVSRWFGVTAKSGRVVGLALFSNSLRGELPQSLGSLANVRELLLHHNMLVGEIPTSLGDLKCLETLDLSANRFSGELPSLAGAQRLVYLNVSQNRLSGAIPADLGRKLNKLEALHLNQNSFTGPIPDSFGSLQRLEVLNVSNCWLTGELPKPLAKLTSLRVVFLGRNRLQGTLDVFAPICYDDEFHHGAPHRGDGQLREVYANDNNFDVSHVHPRLAALDVLFVDRNKPTKPRPPAPATDASSSWRDLHRELDAIVVSPSSSSSTARHSSHAPRQDDDPR